MVFFNYEIGLLRMSKAANKGLPQFIAAAQSENIISRLEPMPGLTRCAPDVSKKRDEIAMGILRDLNDRSGKIALHVSGDGSCLFNAVSVQLCGNESGKLIITFYKLIILQNKWHEIYFFRVTAVALLFCDQPCLKQGSLFRII